jgi:transcriptional regulator with XRE-family HTH domain
LSLSPAECRAARALLKWSQRDLEAAAKVAQKTITDFELENRTPYERTLDALRAALEKAGVELIPEGGTSHAGGPGARLKRRPARKPKAKPEQREARA